MGEGRARGERPGLGSGFGQRVVGELAMETPALAFLRCHHPPGEEQFRGAALADEPRQDRAGAHVAAGEADTGEEERGLGVRMGDAQIRGHGDDRAGADADALERSDDRLRTGAHRLDQIPGHPGELKQARHRHFGQRADNFVDVAA